MPIITLSGNASPLVTSTPYGQNNFGLSSYSSPAQKAATSTGPYPAGSTLGSGYQAQNFNLSSANNLNQLSDLINTINRTSQQQSLQARIPNNPALEAASSANIGSEMQGQVPQDVMNLLGEQAAERGVATGGVGSPNANAAYLRALGLTSLGQQQVGQQNLTAADARNPAAPIFDPTTQLITPYQSAQLGQQGSEYGGNAFLSLLGLQQRGQLAAQQNALRYANPSGTSTATPANPLTGSSLFGPDYSYGNTASGTGGISTDTGAPQDQFQNNLYDFTPQSPMPIDYGSSDYASTPVSMYG